MLAIGIRYLCGVVRAAQYGDRERAEWPPHPDRVFMALAAAHFETDGLPEEKTALEWFERQEPPQMYAGGCQYRETVISYVPVNDAVAPRLNPKKTYSDAQLPERRDRQPRFFPTAIPDDPVVYLLWPNDEPSAKIRSALSELCAKVTYLGHSSSLVQMWVEDHLPEGKEANWVPDERPNGKRFRVCGSGRLAYLETQFNRDAIEEHGQLSADLKAAKGKQEKELTAQLKKRFGDSPPRTMRPAPSRWQTYGRPKQEGVSAKTSRSVFDHNLVVLRRVGGRSFGLESTLQITKALRDTVMSKCPRQPPPEWISGHRTDGGRSEQPHLAVIPLANVGYQHSDGHLLGAGIVVPRGIESSEMRLLNPLADYGESGEPVTTTLTFGSLGEWVLQLDDRDSVPVTLQEARWTAYEPDRPGARRWATVTPIVFDAHPKDRWSKQDSPRVRAERQASYWRQVEGMIEAAAERIGLPRPVEVVARADSPFIGVPNARRFQSLQRKDNGSLRHTHAIITFEEPVVGPVLLGAGRYRGYGLCRPLPGGARS